MRRLSRHLVGWLVAATALLLGGCARSGPDLKEDRLRLADAVDIRTLDTAIGYDTASWRFERLLFDGLLNYSEADATFVPATARALPTIRAGREFTFHLRNDVRFHNGRAVVSTDFKYSIERLFDKRLASPACGLFETIRGAKAFAAGRAKEITGLRCPDPLTFVVELERPDLAFLNIISMPFAYAVPREEVAKWSVNDWPRHVVGSGPYTLAAWEPGVRLRVQKFPGFYDPARGRVRVIEQRFGVPDFLQLMMFERGEIDVSGIPLTDMERVLNTPRFKPLLRSVDENAINYASMNCEMAPFDDKRVRQAFNYAVDRAKVQRIMVNTVKPATGVLPPGMPGYSPLLAGYKLDPQRAKALLAQAGHSGNLAVELVVRDRPTEHRVAESLQSDLANVGVKVSIRPMSFPQWLDLAGQRHKMAFTLNAWFQDYPDPSNFLDILCNGRRITETSCENRSFYSNPAVNRLLDQAAEMTDITARLKVYQQAEQLVVDDAPWIFLYYPTRYVLVQPWVEGYRLHPVWSSREDRVSLKGAKP